MSCVGRNGCQEKSKKQSAADQGKSLTTTELKKTVDLFGEPFDDRKERSEDAPSIRDVAQAMNTTPLKIRKILITTGNYSTELSRRVQSLREQGSSIQQIMQWKQWCQTPLNLLSKN